MADEKKTPTSDDRLATLETRLTDAMGQMSRVSDMAMRLMAAQSAARSAAPVAEVRSAEQQQADDLGINLDDLPDPVTDAKGFKAALAKRVSQATATAAARVGQTMTEKQRAEQSRVENINRMWTDFNTRHPEFANATELVEAQAKEVLSDAVRRGLDPEKYMFADPDHFFEAVAGRTKKRLEALGVKPVDKEAEAKAAAEKAAAEANRTGGIMTGLQFPDVGASAANSQTPQAPKGPAMLEELKDIQRQMKI